MRVSVDDGLVDGEVRTVQAPDGHHAGVLYIGKRVPVELANRRLSSERVRVAPHRIVLDVVGIRGKEAIDVSVLLRREVTREEAIDLVLRHEDELLIRPSA